MRQPEMPSNTSYWHWHLTGFTLVEMVVVIGLVAVVTAITVPVVNRVNESNRSISCQVNLHNIYEAIKMYRLDEDGFPPYNPSENSPTQLNSIGLWALHTYRRIEIPADKAGIRRDGPTARYLRSPKSMHCPDHYEETQSRDPDAPRYFNFDYLSYQFHISTTEAHWRDYDDAGQHTYLTTRTTNVNDPNFNRQLIPKDAGGSIKSKYPKDDTIVTWCPHHRQYSRLKRDNVLFLNGRVELLPIRQTACGDRIGWERIPKRDCE